MLFVKGPNGNPKKIHFGDKSYQQFKDTTPLQAYKHLDHGDQGRRYQYLKRAKGIVRKDGSTSWDDVNSANYYSVKYLWSG